MIELPEAVHIADQLNDTVFGKHIAGITAVRTPHKLAWYYGEPSNYFDLLAGRTVGTANPFGSMVEIKIENTNILFGTDYVWGQSWLTPIFIKALNEYDGFNEQDLAAVESGNANRLFS